MFVTVGLGNANIGENPLPTHSINEFFYKNRTNPLYFFVCRYAYIFLEVIFFFFWGSKQFDFNGLLKYVSTINMVVEEGKKILFENKRLGREK